MANATAKFYTELVLLKVKSRSDEFLEAVALQIEAETKVNIQRNSQIDTGFMLNSTYTVSKRRSTFDDANSSGSYANREGNSVKRQIAPQADLPGKASAAVVVGAQYAIYQESKKPFLYPAAVTIANQVKGRVERVYKEGLS